MKFKLLYLMFIFDYFERITFFAYICAYLNSSEVTPDRLQFWMNTKANASHIPFHHQCLKFIECFDSSVFCQCLVWDFGKLPKDYYSTNRYLVVAQAGNCWCFKHFWELQSPCCLWSYLERENYELDNFPRSDPSQRWSNVCISRRSLHHRTSMRSSIFLPSFWIVT